MAAKTLPACPVETTLTLISDKWKVLILRDLLPGTKRFGELKKSVLQSLKEFQARAKAQEQNNKEAEKSKAHKKGDVEL